MTPNSWSSTVSINLVFDSFDSFDSFDFHSNEIQIFHKYCIVVFQIMLFAEVASKEGKIDGTRAKASSHKITIGTGVSIQMFSHLFNLTLQIYL